MIIKHPPLLIKPLLRLFLFIFLATGTPALAQTQGYKWIFLGGTLQPIATNQGVATPVVIIKYQDPKSFRNHFQLKTAIFNYSQKLDEEIDYNIYAYLRNTGDFNGIYQDGLKQRAPSLYADSLEYSFTKRFYGDDALKAVNLELGLKDYLFSTKDGATAKDKAVVGYMEGRLSVKGYYTVKSKEGEKSLLNFDLSHLSRPSKVSWVLEQERPLQSQRYLAQWEGQRTGEQGVTLAKLEVGASDKLDFMNSFNLGGLASIHQVPGYYRNEFRCDSFQLVSLAHSFALGGKRKVTLRYVEAQVSTLDYLGAAHQSLKIQGANVGLFWPVQELKGLPLVLSYGQGLNVSKKMAEQNRQELFFGAAAAF